MARPVLDESHIHPAIREKVAHRRARRWCTRCRRPSPAHAVVVVGMGMNPFPQEGTPRARRGRVAYHYLEYGNYFNTWRHRNALKMWTGWPTFPMVFVKGTLVGGADELAKLLNSGELKKMLA